MAQPTTYVWVAGDSLSDTGTFSGVTATGRFTNTPGLLWTEIVARHYGASVAPAYLFINSAFQYTGGTNYAQSGAFMHQHGGLFHGHSWSVTRQFDQLIAEAGDRMAGAVLLLDGGGPDILSAAMRVGAGEISVDEAQSNVVAAAQSAGQLALRAAQLPFQRVVWASVADFGKIPALGAGTGPAATLGNMLSVAFNTTFTATLGAPPESLTIMNLLTLFDEWIAHPEQYGLANVTEPGIDQERTPMTPTGSAANANPSHHITAEAPYTYLFADQIHPSARGHELLADAVIKAIA